MTISESAATTNRARHDAHEVYLKAKEALIKAETRVTKLEARAKVALEAFLQAEETHQNELKK